MNRRHWTKQFGRKNFMTNFVQADHFIKNYLITIVDVKVREGFTIKVGISFRVGCSRSPTLQSRLWVFHLFPYFKNDLGGKHDQIRLILWPY